jgi:hypothetical protein
MGAFNIKCKEVLKIDSFSDDNEYNLICYEFGKIINFYSVGGEIYSKDFWNILNKDYNLQDSNITTKTSVEIDEKNRLHKAYKYCVKIDFNKSKIYFTFLDEERGFEKNDYDNFVTEQDMLNKIESLKIYYDPDYHSIKDIEENFITKFMLFMYYPSLKNQFFTICINNNSYALKPSYIAEYDINIKMNYGDTFEETHNKIINKLKNCKKGLFLFHGNPGTGKTTYIRKLISELGEKKTFIYVPSYLIDHIANPELISFITNYKDVVLLLEDAENVLCGDNEYRTQAVANILNMTDGLLNDSMEIQIIATFNTKKSQIDKALSRPGRLMVDYNFKELSINDANRLSNHLGINEKYQKATPLCDIYMKLNPIINDDLNPSNEEKSIGFKFSNNIKNEN